MTRIQKYHRQFVPAGCNGEALAWGAEEFWGRGAQIVVEHGTDHYAADPNSDAAAGRKYQGNTEAVINRAIADLETGTIFIKPGVYQVSSTIVVSKSIMLVGASYNNDSLSTETAGTVLHAQGDYTVVSITSLNRGGCKNLNIRGGGRSNTSAHGVTFTNTNRGLLRDCLFNSCRRAIQVDNCWQTIIDGCHVQGLGGVYGNYDGFYGLEHTGAGLAAVNAVIMSNCTFQDLENDGIRLEACPGSKFTSCEVADAGRHGIYIGDPPTAGKSAQFNHFVNCLVDTCAEQGVKVSKGTATIAGNMIFTGTWAGSVDTAFDFDGCDYITVAGAICQTMQDSVVSCTDCTYITFNNLNGYNYDVNGSNSPGIQLWSTTDSTVTGCSVDKSGTGGSGADYEEVFSCNRNAWSGNTPATLNRVAGSTSFLDSNQYQRLTDDGTINITNGTVFLNKGSAITAVLPTPTVPQDGHVLRVVSETAQTHVLNAAAGDINGATNGDFTFAGARVGEGITLVASNGVWWTMLSDTDILGGAEHAIA